MRPNGGPASRGGSKSLRSLILHAGNKSSLADVRSSIDLYAVPVLQRLTMLGEGGVGKTALTTQFTSNQFVEVSVGLARSATCGSEADLSSCLARQCVR